MPINHTDVRKYSKIHYLAKKEVEGFLTGLHKSPFHGFSVEFAEHKAYNTGESTKHIDWKLYGRTDKLYIKKYNEETNLRCLMLIDSSGSMYFPKDSPSKIHFAIQATACLSYLLSIQRDAFGFSSFSDTVEQSTPIKNSGAHLNNIYNLLDELELKEPNSSTSSIGDSILKCAPKLPKRSLFILFTDFLDSNNDQDKIFEAFQFLKHQNHEIIVFNTLDNARELELDYSNKPHVFTDKETGDKIKLNPYQVKEQYKALLSKNREQIIQKCHQYQIDFIDVDVQKGVDQVLLPYLVRRQKML